MRFVKENPALAAGIGLPVLLVIFFVLATLIPQWTVEPPQYDAIFTVPDYQCRDGEAKVSFEFVTGKIKAKYSYPKKDNGYVNCSGNERIYRFNAKTLVSREITFEIPAKNETNSEPQQFSVPELSDLKIDNNELAPDGYRFNGRNSYYSGGFFPFDNYHYHNGMSISKGGRVVSLSPINNDRYYSYSDINFLGWIIPEGDKK